MTTQFPSALLSCHRNVLRLTPVGDKITTTADLSFIFGIDFNIEIDGVSWRLRVTRGLLQMIAAWHQYSSIMAKKNDSNRLVCQLSRSMFVLSEFEAASIAAMRPPTGSKTPA